MNIARFLRNLVIFFASLFVFQHVLRVCPLKSPLQYNSLSEDFDPVCIYTHKSYDLISPYLSSAYEFYEKSPIKPYVDAPLDAYVKPGFDVVSEHLDKLSSYVSAYREAHEQSVIDTVEYSSKSISGLITTIAEFINRTIFPVVRECTKIAISRTNIYSRKLRLYCYLKWNIYAKPFLLRGLDKFLASRYGEFLIQFERSEYFQMFEQTVAYIYRSMVVTFHYMSEKVNYIYEIILASRETEAYKTMQFKQAFLNDFAKYLPGSFNFKSSQSTTSSSTTTTTSISVSLSSPPLLSISVSSTTVSPSVSTGEKYESLLKNTISSASEDFVSQVNELAEEYKARLHNKLQPEMRALAENVNTGYDDIHDLLNRINQVKDETNPLYVSRQDYRDALAAKKSSIEVQAQEIEDKMVKETENFLDDVLKIRVSIIETLEEFADSTLNAYSAAIISNGDDWKEWKKYKDLKNSLIKFRDELIDKKPVDDLTGFLNKLKRDTALFANEAGSYMSILRAKANIEFQSREKEEKEAREEELARSVVSEERAEEEQSTLAEIQAAESTVYEYDDDEEEETLTITQTRYVTQTLDSDVETEATSVGSVSSEYIVNLVQEGSDEVKVLLEPVDDEDA
ncbi:hypothetical protein PICMEDRAFT_14025 [Pichia membranifaciens NRRL Y-2026]|uniref:Outer spore wall assembly protein SHE10 n=1 Tax=Pichia membranifaciens NRRL Y-2026 TaxID=763406 RepID=A0A1E3NS94_9ASCO|nr:hypothetical protein PICMEDRAFT_14025 [Pichia membranifaciens NRRL Y-2026]ODQ48453.1 hypothetical protein PICMEDRAFT_14025 [Pichia membranifaciens NRRL Y-2026]